jgi:hypothetical protein
MLGLASLETGSWAGVVALGGHTGTSDREISLGQEYRLPNLLA